MVDEAPTSIATSWRDQRDAMVKAGDRHGQVAHRQGPTSAGSAGQDDPLMVAFARNRSVMQASSTRCRDRAPGQVSKPRRSTRRRTGRRGATAPTVVNVNQRYNHNLTALMNGRPATARRYLKLLLERGADGWMTAARPPRTSRRTGIPGDSCHLRGTCRVASVKANPLPSPFQANRW
jgi:hypothetical protein